jgi:hypothetical protein
MRKNKRISKLNEKQLNHIPLNPQSKNNIKETLSNSFIQGIGFGTAMETIKNISSAFQSSNTSTIDNNKKINNDNKNINIDKDMNKDNLENKEYDFTCSDLQEKTFTCVKNNYDDRDVCKDIINEYNKCIRNIYNPE